MLHSVYMPAIFKFIELLVWCSVKWLAVCSLHLHTICGYLNAWADRMKRMWRSPDPDPAARPDPRTSAVQHKCMGEHVWGGQAVARHISWLIALSQSMVGVWIEHLFSGRFLRSMMDRCSFLRCFSWFTGVLVDRWHDRMAIIFFNFNPMADGISSSGLGLFHDCLRCYLDRVMQIGW